MEPSVLDSGQWLFHDKLYLGHLYCPRWKRGGLYLRENGGRKRGECLSITLTVGKHDFNVTFWGMGKVSWFTRWIPAPKRMGYHIGWEAKGANDD